MKKRWVKEKQGSELREEMMKGKHKRRKKVK